jgi:hypothetical protein
MESNISLSIIYRRLALLSLCRLPVWYLLQEIVAVADHCLGFHCHLQHLSLPASTRPAVP